MSGKQQQIIIDGKSIDDFEKSRTLKDSRWLAHRLGCSYEKARQMGRLGQVPVIRVGKLLRYCPQTIDAFIAAQMSKPGAAQ